MKHTVEKAAKEAIHNHYNCNGKYPCSERKYCRYCDGSNTAFDCKECGTDEFKDGFIAGAEWMEEKMRTTPKKQRRMCLRDKSKPCNLCHECDVYVLNPNYCNEL